MIKGSLALRQRLCLSHSLSSRRCSRMSVLGAGFFTTQKAQETVYKGVEQSTANIQMVGNVYGFSTSDSHNYQDYILDWSCPGAPAIDLTKMKIVFSTPTTTPIILTHKVLLPVYPVVYHRLNRCWITCHINEAERPGRNQIQSCWSISEYKNDH